MNILNKIKKKWDFSRSVEQNAIYFNTRENQKKKARKKMLFLALFVLAIAMFFHNPLLGMAMMIGAITYGSEYVFNSAATKDISVSALDSTHFVVTYQDDGGADFGCAKIGTVSGSNISYGSEYVFNSAATYDTSVSALDSTHFVVGYMDGGNSYYGTAIIGTVSGSTISYGSEYVFNSAEVGYIGVSALDSTHFVVTYQDAGNSNYGTAIIGTVSGSNISYGSEATFNSAATYYIGVSALDSTHFVVVYRDTSNYGTAIIGTVSGSTISYGSEYVFNSAATRYIFVSNLDSTHFVVTYEDTGNSLYGTAAIGVVSSGNVITFGSEYVFNSAATTYLSVSALDSTHFVVAFKDDGGSDYGITRLGTVANGDEISYEDEVVFNSAVTNYISVSALDSINLVVGYQDTGNSNYGTAIIGELPSGTDYFKTLSETITINDTLLNKTSRVFYEAFSIIDSTSVQKTLKRTLSETITIVDNIDAKKIATKTFSEIISIVDTIKINISKIFSETISIIDNLSIQKALKRTLSETISIVDSIEKSIIKFKTLVENISIVDSITKKTSRAFTETVTIVDSITKKSISFKSLSEAITITDSISRKIGKVFTETISIIGSFAAQTYKVARATIKYTGQVLSKLKNTENIKAKIKKIINN